MYCSQCGAANPDGAKFCRACGARILVSDTPSQPEPTPVPASSVAASRSAANGRSTFKDASPSDVSPLSASTSEESAHGRSRAGLAIGILTALVIALAAIGMFSMDGGGSGNASDDNSRGEAAGEKYGPLDDWAPADYMDPAFYDRSFSQIISALDNDGFTSYTASVTEEGFYSVQFRKESSDERSFPYAPVGGNIFVQVDIYPPKGFDAASIESLEDIPESSTLQGVDIAIYANLGEEDLVTTGKALCDGLGVVPSIIHASSESLLVELSEKLHVSFDSSEDLRSDADGANVWIGAISEQLFPNSTGTGGWSVTCTANGEESLGTIRLHYIPMG